MVNKLLKAMIETDKEEYTEEEIKNLLSLKSTNETKYIIEKAENANLIKFSCILIIGEPIPYYVTEEGRKAFFSKEITTTPTPIRE